MLATVGGTTAVFSKISLQDIPPLSFVFIRLLIMALVIGAYNKARSGKLPSLQAAKLFALVATFWWLNPVLFAFGLQKTTAATAQLIHVSVPI